jgi:signal transduction histidine kinase
VSPQNRALLEVVQRNGHRLLKLVNTLLEFSRIEAGRAEACYEPVDLAALTADLASNFRSACERVGLKLTVDCAALAEPAHVDREMWEKIVLNLISNAFKFTFEGGITVQVRDAGKRFELAVSDSGAGIPAEELPRMFERFHQVAGTRGRSHEGSGIGLALVQELVKLHAGEIDVQSAPGKGSTFTVSIPKGNAHLRSDQIGPGQSDRIVSGAGAYVEEALSWLAGSATAAETAQAVRKQRILLADDNADLRGYARRLLAEHYDVETVSNGEAALAAARERRPDLIVTDVMMPQLDGFSLIRALRADARLFDVPVVVLSARAGEEARIEGLDKGADDYLVKPFSARELIVRVEALLRSAKVRGHALEQERQETDVLRDTDRRKDESLTTLSHELRNSLTPVCNAVELLGMANGDAQLIAEARGILARQVNSLVRLVDDLLELSRISQGSIELRKSAVDLASIVAGSVETSGPAIAAAGHELRTTLPERSVMLYADSVRITQILANLLNNAAKYTRRGGRIDLTAQCGHGEVEISVRDNGMGIAPEMLPRVFDMFVRAHDSKGTGSGGLGVGLWLARTLAEQHGGSLQARSEGRGQGSEFILRLPVLEPEHAISAPTFDGQALARGARRVLIVEDHVDTAESLGTLLRNMGHEVRIVYEGRAAVRAASERVPDVVLLDIGLPDMDGYQVAACLRRDLRLMRVPIVAVTARGREEDRQRSREAGFQAHLMKPVAAEALRAVLSESTLPA